MHLNNYNNIQNIADAFGVAFNHPDTVNNLTNRYNTVTALEGLMQEPANLRDAMRDSHEDEWPTLIDQYAARKIKGDAIRQVMGLGFKNHINGSRALAIEENTWHYISQLPLEDCVNEYVKAVKELGDDWNDANAAMENGKGAAASIAHACEVKLETLKAFKAIVGAKDSRLVALLVDPPKLPPLIRKKPGKPMTVDEAEEHKKVGYRHNRASRVRTDIGNHIRAIAAGDYDLLDTYPLTVPTDENDYNRRIAEWDKINVYQS